MNKRKKIDRTALEIAVIGMAGRFPDAKNIAEFWDNLRNGKESVTFFSDEDLENRGGVDPLTTKDPNYVKAGGVVQDVEYFDASFFSYIPPEAEIMDPQMRFFHECTWEALEDAGYDPDSHDGLIGLYAGAALNLQWEGLSLLSGRIGQLGNFASMSLMNKEYLTTKISYKLNLRGPSSFVHTACSTSLVAIHWACRAILNGECHMAVAGAVKMVDFPPRGYMYETDMILAPDGHCRAFDAKAKGTIPGSGIGVVVLKRLKNALKDRDNIYAVIKGTAVNNDGNRKVGYTAPSVEGQAEVIRAAMAMARVDVESIGYIEAHGTGTPMGDQAEIEALKLAFNTNKKKFCSIGSVKTNIGHLDVAAGAAGFIKAVLALKHGLIPPSLHFETPNPAIDFENSPFYVVDRLTEWKRSGHPLRTGVSSFGIGGTNAHVILEEAPAHPKSQRTAVNGSYVLIPLSAKTPSALHHMTQNLVKHLKHNSSILSNPGQNPGVNLADMAYTLQVGRQAFQYRRMTVCANVADAIEALSSADSGKFRSAYAKEGKKSPIFMFSGLGSQYVNMGADLYRTEPIFRQEMDRCFNILKPLMSYDLKDILYPGDSVSKVNKESTSVSSVVENKNQPATNHLQPGINYIEIAQLAVFVLEYSLAKLIMNYGIKPHAMIGYSIGEYTAACLADVFSLEDALKLMVARGRLVAKIPTGTMLSAPLPAKELKPFLNEEIAIAIDNGPSCIVAGPDRHLDALQDKLKEKRYLCMRLSNSHAIHSRMMEPILKEFEEFLRTVTFNKPQIPYVSNVTGQWITVEDARAPGYWCKHLAQTVRFAEGIDLLKKEPNPIFIEIGPGRDLSTLLVRHKEKDPEVHSVNLIRASQQDVRDNYYLLSKIGQLWLHGAAIDWNVFYNAEERHRIPLPTYPFDRHRFWFEGNPFRTVSEIFNGQTLSPGKPNVKFFNSLDEETDTLTLSKRSELSTPYAPATTETEKILVNLWEEFFGIKPVGIDDDFFELGGDSLKAQVLMSGVQKALDVRIPLAKVFSSSTLRGLAAYIKEADEEQYSFIETLEEQDDYELSYAQRRLWVLSQLDTDATAYNMPRAAVISGAFNPDAFYQAVQALVDRHESLRTIFIMRDEEPRQRVFKNLVVNEDVVFLETFDLRSLDEKEKEEKAQQIYNDTANRTFDLEKLPLMVFSLVRLENEKYVMIFNIHHIINDGWSQGVLDSELSTLYNAFRQGRVNPLSPLTLQCKDYSHWHNRLVEGAYFKKAGEYWLEKFKDRPNGVELPTDHSRKQVQTFNGGNVFFFIGNENAMRLQELTLTGNATFFMNMLTLLNIFLYKYTAQEDILVGAPVANRKSPELHNIVGFLVNILVYRNRINPAQTFKHVLAEIKKEASACYEHQDFPFNLLMEKLEPDRDVSKAPLFNVFMVVNNAEFEHGRLTMDRMSISDYPHRTDYHTSKFDLSFLMSEKEDGIFVGIEYNCDLFEYDTVERMAANFQTLVARVIDIPDEPISSFDILTESEYETVVEKFNDNNFDYPSLSLQELFERQVEKTPDKTAVVGGALESDASAVTYRELNAWVNRIARYLRNNPRFAVKPNDVIGISLDRTIDLIAIILAVIKSGAGYLAVDPSYPRERVRHILSDSKSKALIIDEMRPELFGAYDAEILDINVLRDEIQKESKDNPTPVNQPSDILYVSYTSGSTGVPHGSMLSHDCLTNLIRWHREHSGVDCSLRCLQFTSINFCVAFQEIMGTLTAGGELHMIGEIERQDTDYLMEFLSKRQINILCMPFSYLNFLFNEPDRWDRRFKHDLKHITTAGEQPKITPGLKQFLDLNPGLKLHNHYGSTEMHVVTSYTLDASTADQTPLPPAGKPVNNVKIYILDDDLCPTPVGVWGELFIKGSTEFLGYIYNEKLNAEKLIHHPRLSRGDNIKLYRSGDIGRWKPGGNIELLGRRKDFMVKVNGFRVEPGEIESKVLAIDRVRECVVVIREDEAKQKYIVAYVAADEILASEITQILKTQLPQHMIPKIVLLDKLPKFPNGKVNRKDLPDAQLGTREERVIVPPADEVERKLLEIWAELLSVEKDQIGVEDNFFDLGGSSLQLIIIKNKMKKIFENDIPIVKMFFHPTIRSLANYLSKNESDNITPYKKIKESADQMEDTMQLLLGEHSD